VISGYYKEKIKSELAKICEDIFDILNLNPAAMNLRSPLPLYAFVL
jgi:hypothetical protein